MTNTTPVNISAVEELREKFDEKIGNWLDYTHKVGYQNCPDKETAWNWFLTHTTTLQDSTLRTVLGEVGEDEETRFEYHDAGGYHVGYNEKTAGKNVERQRIRQLIKNKINDK